MLNLFLSKAVVTDQMLEPILDNLLAIIAILIPVAIALFAVLKGTDLIPYIIHLFRLHTDDDYREGWESWLEDDCRWDWGDDWYWKG